MRYISGNGIVLGKRFEIQSKTRASVYSVNPKP